MAVTVVASSSNAVLVQEVQINSCQQRLKGQMVHRLAGPLHPGAPESV